ncbi:MAG TPA: protein-disulfide reductase DsbD domain-containing protein [Tepidisphaeraceae bacterium]|jgi:DsbC/DsbD-like thiol-disulfide interchange protein|nr:protein-disulfide reductase DsbD domain-containing protein [Tepidisphaeraceae bacterium]
MKWSVALLGLCVLINTRPARAAPPASPVKATLLADVSAIKPGEPFTVGVLLEMEPEWHVYWTNPGESGLAPSVKFTLPPGFSTSPLAFPVPTRFDQPDNAVAYGYRDRVLLTARITTPKDLPIGRDFEIGASVSWLCCKDACIPGKAKTTLSLNVADGIRSANQELFKTWIALVPVPAARSPDIAKIDATLDSQSHSAVVTLRWKNPPKHAEFFPGADDAVSVKEITAKTTDQVTHITMRLELLPGQTPASDSLPSVVAYDDGQGHRRAVEVNVPLK